MRTLAITQNITVDGRVEMLGDWFDAQGQGDQADLIEENHRQDAAADAFVCGRQTFTDLRGYWRDLEDDTTGVSDYLNAVAKYVVSSTWTDADADWDGTTVLRGVEDVARLKEQPGRDIVCTGSISLCHDLVRAGLVDEYRLFTYPVVQGRGRGLWPEGFEIPRLRRQRSLAFASGITLATYAVESS